MDYNCYLVNLCPAHIIICNTHPNVWLTCLQYAPSCDLTDPHKFVTLSVNMPVYRGLNAGKKGTFSPLEGSQTHCLPHPHPHYLHLALHTCADTSNPILACTKCIRLKWPRVYVLLGENTDRENVGAESTVSAKRISDIMTGEERPVKIQLHIWSRKILLSFLEMSLLLKYYK